ncbi:MAG TPA: HAD family acid phosphatase [Ignavibacteria bacterium]|nr:HAD family acid phosphatase [Ignavibacteria bacterium]
MKIKYLLLLFFVNLSLIFTNAFAQDEFLLSDYKDLLGYYNSGGFDNEINDISDHYISLLQNISVTEGKSAIVFDLDETLLSNIKLYERNTEWYDTTWSNWVKGLNSFAMPTKKIYDFAKEKGFKIILITGSPDTLEEYIKENLKRNGYDGYDTLICRPPQFYTTTALEYKSHFRKLFSESGLTIEANCGDQYSDMGGGYSGIFMRIPNYIYYIK